MKGTVLVTGGAARIGRHISKGLADDGWTVIIHFNRSDKPAHTLTSEINSNGGKAFALGANLAVPVERDNLIAEARDMTKRPITALINNASTFTDDRAQSFTRQEYSHHMDVNLYAAISLSRDFSAQLPKDTKGCIVNMIDQRILNPDPDYFTYAISKAALYAATRTLAQSLAPQVRVNGIGPGPTMQNKSQTEIEFAEERKSTLLEDGSPPDTILDGVRYLLDAKAVTGQMLVIDGGQHLSWNEESV